MRKETWLATLSYLSSILLLLSFLYWFLKNEGFNETTFLFGGMFTLLLAVGWGYIIASHLILPRKKTQEYLLDLTKNIIHELNIPLATIQANSSMVARKLEDEKLQKRLKRIEDATSRLRRLYEELVYVIKKEVHEIKKEVFDLKYLIEERTEIFKEQQRNPIILTLESFYVLTDKIGFEQMFDNLLVNAMKYSSKEMPIEIRLTNDTLKIIDRGIGMDETQIVKVFEHYYQGDIRQKGEGIGLALVKAFCDGEKITITINSQKDKGTEVILDLTKIIHTLL
ncbi:MAG: HAMP domain-containing histidine kinase [Sulfurovum sp.]|nr:HAMP domain-containing histidine kinase [Sulfurovum sp.]MCB4744503.1 HAMP domain-containing histidine kinase [Sulfurovum sp.]MCB4746278.1 HAMP domain-containing histidine kinase [Sulfurovum sp.]MCB4748902.1 HAMP domain-containing histidine kinase [Sulfurovum sp.]MCB4751641.1 HAMP domain-containing histidine kinase [Sulfurovum sp.]